MPKLMRFCKETGLRYGDASKIARIHRVTPQHVRYVALGERKGTAGLMETIRRYQQRASEQQQPPQHCDAA